MYEVPLMRGNLAFIFSFWREHTLEFKKLSFFDYFVEMLLRATKYEIQEEESGKCELGYLVVC